MRDVPDGWTDTRQSPLTVHLSGTMGPRMDASVYSKAKEMPDDQHDLNTIAGLT